MEKISELEMEKLQLLREEEQRVSDIKMTYSDLEVALSLTKEEMINRVKMFSNAVEEFKTNLKKKYGTDKIDAEGKIIRDQPLEAQDTVKAEEV